MQYQVMVMAVGVAVLAPGAAILNCSLRPDGSDYAGPLAHSHSGLPCLPHNTTASRFCRNKDASPNGPWCFVGAGKREACNVPVCGMNPASRLCAGIWGNPEWRQACPVWMEPPPWPLHLTTGMVPSLNICCLRVPEFQPHQLPIGRNCLLAILPRTAVSHNYSVCPLGYKLEPDSNMETGGRVVMVMYRCCGLDVRGLSLPDGNSSSISRLLLAAITDAQKLCHASEPHYIAMEMVQVVSNDIKVVPSNTVSIATRYFSTICLFRHRHRTALQPQRRMLQLAVMTYASQICPLNLTRGGSAPFSTSLKPLHLCLLTYLTPPVSPAWIKGGLCLLVISGPPSADCPIGLISYRLEALPNPGEGMILRMCCSDGRGHLVWHVPLQADQSLVVPVLARFKSGVAIGDGGNNCPYMITNVTVRSTHYRVPLHRQSRSGASGDWRDPYVSTIQMCGYEPTNNATPETAQGLLVVLSESCPSSSMKTSNITVKKLQPIIDRADNLQRQLTAMGDGWDGLWRVCLLTTTRGEGNFSQLCFFGTENKKISCQKLSRVAIDTIGQSILPAFLLPHYNQGCQIIKGKSLVSWRGLCLYRATRYFSPALASPDSSVSRCPPGFALDGGAAGTATCFSTLHPHWVLPGLCLLWSIDHKCPGGQVLSVNPLSARILCCQGDPHDTQSRRLYPPLLHPLPRHSFQLLFRSTLCSSPLLKNAFSATHSHNWLNRSDILACTYRASTNFSETKAESQLRNRRIGGIYTFSIAIGCLVVLVLLGLGVTLIVLTYSQGIWGTPRSQQLRNSGTEDQMDLCPVYDQINSTGVSVDSRSFSNYTDQSMSRSTPHTVQSVLSAL